MNDDVQNEVAERIYSELMDAGIEVLLDDRRERAGVKFNDADLLGIPVRITVGRDAADGKVEYKLRREEDNSLIPVEQAIKDAVELIRAER
jgi:prolyl-tRNA synthetase